VLGCFDAPIWPDSLVRSASAWTPDRDARSRRRLDRELRDPRPIVIVDPHQAHDRKRLYHVVRGGLIWIVLAAMLDRPLASVTRIRTTGLAGLENAVLITTPPSANTPESLRSQP